MPIYVEVVDNQCDIPESDSWLSPDRPVVRAGISKADGCPILTRLKAFLVKQGIPSTLQNIYRNIAGVPVDLSGIADTAVLRVKEYLSTGRSPRANPVWTLPVEIVSAANGVLEAVLPPDLVDHAGIYNLAWGINDSEGILIGSNDGLLSVERSLFASDFSVIEDDKGPMTINEIRLALRDSGRADNLLLDDVEFGDSEIAFAIARPVAYWNEVPPPLRQKYTTKNFPFREHWLRAISGYLFQTAADNYRRNNLNYQSGGLSIGDKDKEKQYLMAGKTLLDEYQTWVLNKKVSINCQLFVGNVGSEYRYRR